MSRMKKWSELEGQPLSFDVNSTTEEAMQDTEHPSRIHMTTDGRVVMNGVILGDRNPQRGKWDGRVVINKAVPCYARAGMAYYFSDGIAKFKIKKEQFDECNDSYGAQIVFKGYAIDAYDNAGNFSGMIILKSFNMTVNDNTSVSQLCSLKDECTCGVSFAVNFDSQPIVVVILKDGNIFEKGKYKIINPQGHHTIQPRRQHYTIRDGRIYFTKNPFIQTYTQAEGGLNYDNAPYTRIRWRYIHRKPVRYYDTESKSWVKIDYQRRTVMRPLNRIGAENFTVALYPTFTDKRGRKTKAELGGWICRCKDGYAGQGGERVRIEPLKRVYASAKKGIYLK